MVRSWRFVRATALACLGMGWMLAGACGGRTTPIVCSDATQGPKAIFGEALQIPTPDGPYKLFQGGKEYGCVGLRWSNQAGDPPSFVVQYNPDGKYLVRDGSGNFSDASVSAAVSAGVDKFDVFFFLSKESPDSIDCKSYVQRGLESCVSKVGANAKCVLAWRIQGVTMGGDNGVCKLCYREQCNGRDDDCNDDGSGTGIDDAGACGSVLGQSCLFVPTVDAKTAGCDANTKDIKCLLDGNNEAYLCAGTVAEPTALQWRKVPEVAAGCNDANDGKSINTGGKELLCDLCDNKRTFRLKDGPRCAENAVVAYTPPK